MIDLPVTLTSNGHVQLPGYGSFLCLGYTKNKGVYRLCIDAESEWAGLVIRCCWHLPGGGAPASTLVKDGSVAVPASVTAQPGNGCVTFEGSDGTRTVTSADLRYRVAANSGTEDGSIPEPGTPAWQELVGAVHTDAAAAEQAKTDAQTAATESAASAEKAAASKKAAGDAQAKAAESLQELKNGIASGDFKGEPGTSPTVTVQDITGGHRIVITDATGTSSVDVLNGKQGDPGKPGETGATPELTIGTVEEGDAPSATITGTAKNPVLNLTLKSGAPGKDATVDATLSQSGQAADAKVTGDALATKAVIDDTTVTDSAPWSSKHLVDMLCPPLDETGNPVQCYPVENYPLGVTASWEPTQEGSGEPSPENVRPIKGRDTVKVERCGEQLLSYSQPIETDSDIRVAIMSSDQILLLANAAHGQTFETSFDLETANVVWADYDEDWRRRIGFEAALTKASDGLVAYQFQCWINSTSSEFKATGKITVKNVISLLDDRYTDSAESELFFYVQNMKSGHVKVTNLSIKLVQNTAYTPYQGDTLALRLPTTIYGGEVDAVTGEGQETWKLVTPDGNDLKFLSNANNTFWNMLSNTAPGIALRPRIKCTHINGSLFSSNTNYDFIFTTKKQMVGLFETVDELNAYCAAQYAAGTPVQIAYKLEKPMPFTATGAQPIPALPGVNTVLTDADSVTVTGRADPIKRITDLEDAVASMTNT